jgi:hypothetical protein
MVLLLALACNREEEIVCSDPTLSAVGRDLTFTGGCAQWVARGRPLGPGDFSVRWEVDGQTATPIVTGEGTFYGLLLDGSLGLDGEEDPVLWKQGYQSWWWSGVTELQPLDWAERVPVAGGDGDGISAINETPGTSWWVGLLGRPNGASFLIGATGITTTKWYSAFEHDRAIAVWGGRGERIVLNPEDELRLDPMWVGAGLDSWALHQDYAVAVADAQGIAPRSDLPHTGWATWSVYYEDITEDDVRDALDTLPPELDLVQLDDGWQKRWGNWKPDEDFAGWDTLATDIADSGHTPGLWLAPFYVERGLGMYDQHPDWFVHQDGEPISFSNLGDNDYLILDVTHPDAATFFQKNLSDRVDEGWTYFKLDFLYAGMQEGMRQEQVTGAQAYALGMQLIREALGDSYFLACGAPMLPSVGYADSFRTGADIAFGFDPDGQPEYLRWQARATAARGWQNGIWWWNDPDQIMLREPVDPSGALVAGLVSGGAWLYGDAADDVDPRFIDPEVLALVGQGAVPRNPLSFVSGVDFGPVAELSTPDDSVPTIWDFPNGEVALLNLGKTSVTVDSPGGTELLSGETAQKGTRTLEPGTGEIWR